MISPVVGFNDRHPFVNVDNVFYVMFQNIMDVFTVAFNMPNSVGRYSPELRELCSELLHDVRKVMYGRC